ncbi:MAG: rhamnulokinase [Chloroflexi bacterium]|nr:rhamnulokinase [Chloroflexota bacterium]
MTAPHNYLALDLGAESGRAILGALHEEKLTLTETHRFSNGPVRLHSGTHWDVLRLWGEIKAGIAASVKSGGEIAALGVDTWGVDFALLDSNHALLANPYHYRDARTDGMLEEAFRRMPRPEIFAHTGIQFMQINTLYQLLAMAVQNSPLFDAAAHFLAMPDLFNFWLSGEIANEFTIATTTQCLNPHTREWAAPVLAAMGIPTRLFQPVTQPGAALGRLAPHVAEETGAGEAQVVLPACHDTGSAVVAVPAEGKDFAWLSSGTWSIMGVESQAPCLDEHALEYNFTNEGGVFGTWRLSKNIMGLWLVQECKREWGLSYDELTRLAAGAQPFLAAIDPDNSIFLHPGAMPEKILAFCRQSGQAAPQTRGEIIRTALESLALKYRFVLEHLETLAGQPLAPLHIFGGGSKNRLLNQFTADCTGKTVVAGPVEATAAGNILMQAIALRQIASLAEARAIVRQSFSVETYHPVSRAGWDGAYARFVALMASNAA